MLAELNHTIYIAINCTINGATDINTISANDLKTKGVSAIEQYAHLRECELEAALAESKADLDAGRFVKETVEQHITRLAKLAA